MRWHGVKQQSLALNRGEAYNKLYNAVANVGGKKFRGSTELEIEIWHQCTRLITLIIIYYNMYLLSRLIDQKLQLEDKQAAGLIERVSPLAIRHLNLGGIYNYADDGKDTIDIDSMINALNEALEELLIKRGKLSEESE